MADRVLLFLFKFTVNLSVLVIFTCGQIATQWAEFDDAHQAPERVQLGFQGFLLPSQ